MTFQNIEDTDPQIKEVLKALNHTVRRDILLYLKNLNREVSFSELMDYLNIDAKTSGQFSYHLKMLQQSNLITKSNEKYLITPLGVKATSMLDLVNISDHNDSIVQTISNSFKNITPIDQIILSFHAFCYIAFILPFLLLLINYNRFAIFLAPMLIGLILLIAITIYSYLKLKYIPSILILFSLIWVIFLTSNQKSIAFIYVVSGLDIVFLYNAIIATIFGKNNFLFFSFVITFIIASIIGIGIIFYKIFIKKPITSF